MDVHCTCSVTQVLKVVEACSNYLRAQLDVENCVDIVTIAETYSLDTLRDKVYRFMSENLAVFAQRPEFHRLSANQVMQAAASWPSLYSCIPLMVREASQFMTSEFDQRSMETFLGKSCPRTQS